MERNQTPRPETGRKGDVKQVLNQETRDELRKDPASSFRAINQKAEKRSKDSAQDVEGESGGSNNAQDQDISRLNEECPEKGLRRSEDKLDSKTQPKSIEDQIEKMRVTVETAKDLCHVDIIGYQWTHVALKNPNSFLIGTFGMGLKLIEDSIFLYTGKLPPGNQNLFDIIYIPSLKFYLIATLNQLYRKDINGKPPFMFMRIQCGSIM